METTPLLLGVGTVGSVREAGRTAQLLMRVQDGPDWGSAGQDPHISPWPPALLPPPRSPRPSLGKGRTVPVPVPVPGWAGAGPRGRSRLTQSYRKSGAGGAGGENHQLPASPLGRRVGAWVGFRLRRGCDCKARKLRGKFLLKRTNKSQGLAVLGDASGAAVVIWTGPGAQPSKEFAPKHT